jgi:hypothetical protein
MSKANPTPDELRKLAFGLWDNSNDEAAAIVQNVAAELERLQAIEAAALAYVNEDGRGDPPAKYQALKAALDPKP